MCPVLYVSVVSLCVFALFVRILLFVLILNILLSISMCCLF